MLGWDKLSIKWKMLLSLTLIIVVPLIITTTFIQINNYKNLKVSLANQGKTNVEVVKNKLQDENRRLKRVGNDILNNQQLVNILKREDAEMLYVKLNKIMKEQDLDLLTYFLPDGRVVRRGNNSRQFKDKLPFQKILNKLEEREDVFTTYIKYPQELIKKEDTSNNKLSNKVIVNNQQQDGLVLASIVPVRFLGEVVGGFLLGEVVNNSGSIYDQKLNKMLFSKQEDKKGFSGIKLGSDYIVASNQFWDKDSGLKNISKKKLDRNYLLFETPIKNIIGDQLGNVVYGIPKSRLKKNLTESIWILAKSILTAVIVMFFISIFISSKISTRLKKIINKLRRVAQGDLTVRLDMERKDELGQLTDEFNKTIKAEQEFMNKLLAAINEISAYSQQLSSSAEEGNIAVDSTVTNINQISTAVQQIASSSQEVAGLAENAHSKTQQGEQKIEKTMTKIEDIDSSIRESEKVIKELDNTSQQIGKIVEMITEIAEQTNLLALNASIEAARANKEGTGFAVVADEIKSLADETTAAADKAIELIEETQEKSKVGLATIKDVTKQTEEGVKLVNETKEVFIEISDVVEDTSAYTEETTASTEEVAANSDRITNTTDDINNMSQEISKSAEDLANLAQDLKELVSKYNL